MFEVLLNHQALETLGTTNVIVDEICVKERGLSMWPDVRDGKTVRRKKRL